MKTFRHELKMALEQRTETVVHTWRLTWNPTKWDWDDYDEVGSLSRIGKGYLTGWNCATVMLRWAIVCLW